MKRRVDEVRAARALRKLDEHARAHPEAFDPARLPSSPDELAATLGERRPPATDRPRKTGRPPLPDAGITVGVRIPPSLLGPLDAAVAASDPPLARAEAIRQAIRLWLKRRRR